MTSLGGDNTGQPPRRGGRLAVHGGHVLAWQECGPIEGLPVLLLHGGPGSAISPRLMQQAATGCVRAIGFDQRGCGSSTPAGETRDNTTAHLLRDIEELRLSLGIDRWLVTGGSWGATLALLYAATYPQRVRGLLLRNFFVPSAENIRWFFQGAAAHLPQAWEQFAAIAPAARRNDMLGWLAEVFEKSSSEQQHRAAMSWLSWEHALSGAAKLAQPSGAALHALVQRYRIQTHYLVRSCWISPGELRNAAAGIHDVPVLFVHGKGDRVCRPESARDIQRLIAGSGFVLVPGSHDPFAPEMDGAVRGAIETFARCGSFELLRASH